MGIEGLRSNKSHKPFPHWSHPAEVRDICFIMNGCDILVPRQLSRGFLHYFAAQTTVEGQLYTLLWGLLFPILLKKILAFKGRPVVRTTLTPWACAAASCSIAREVFSGWRVIKSAQSEESRSPISSMWPEQGFPNRMRWPMTVSAIARFQGRAFSGATGWPTTHHMEVI